MTDDRRSGDGAEPASAPAGAVLAAHAQEVGLLKKRIDDLQKLVETLVETHRDTDALESRVVQMREANQNLVLAALGAQDLQATAELNSVRQTEFLSMLAHELRNPLAPIAMANELLGRMVDAHPRLSKLHGIIHRQVSHMVRLVDDLLDASRVSSGKITLRKRPLLLSDIIDSAVETSQPFIDKRYQRLRIELPPVPVVVYGDLVRLAQVFSNLLINATKFTPECEEIAILAQVRSGAVQVTVKDHGSGIAPDIQPFIFDLFTQGFRSLDRSQGGLGIGLSLVRSIVEMHAGTATVYSRGVGFGSEFTVSLPLSTQALSFDHEAVAAPIPRRHSRILIIEDNIDANETLKLVLEMEGYAVDAVFDGPAGVAMAKQSSYDAIICDIGLPGMDGYAVVRQLRLDLPGIAPCFIATSGYNQLEDRHRAIEVGFDHYLVKPVALDALLAIISSDALT